MRPRIFESLLVFFLGGVVQLGLVWYGMDIQGHSMESCLVWNPFCGRRSKNRARERDSRENSQYYFTVLGGYFFIFVLLIFSVCFE